ncbi:hypothetical protein A6V39_04750 [Candidatus Mycoplasma haematobovis]|uniref:Phosphatidate cytidylyltransferase n=1 Tax=Candidatus Mycoplasma haematobovis TaxID=432608 RepID=A0A1A9QDU0_9MOLU|nr:phosphatidate cytidylyltransferase [Candidatus Mycoplasma haematobovis]OAL09860.1 hypothetical protein A6V39_04750 [Candidatus Mycoplasma haematobovis]
MQLQSRAATALLVVASLSLFILLNAILPKTLVLPFELLALSSLVFISFKEINALESTDNYKAIIFSFITLAPFLWLVIAPEGYLIYYLYWLLFLYVIGVASWRYFKKDKWVFLQLNALAYCFWNAFIFLSLVDIYLMALLLGAVMINDTLAYWFGSKYGQRRVFEWSPNKTLEGFLFPIAPVTFLTLVVTLIGRWSVKGAFSTVWITLLMPVILLMANMGDLVFSKYKRYFNIKDYSALLGAHGGFWDRFDSHTFALNTTFFFLFFFVVNGNL